MREAKQACGLGEKGLRPLSQSGLDNTQLLTKCRDDGIREARKQT